MRTALSKDFWREVSHTRSRFLSILILVALSVAFLSGLKATAPDMKHTGDDYLDSLRLHDIQVLSTLGLTQADLDALLARPEIEAGEAAYVIDAYASSATADLVAKVYSLSEGGVNDVSLRAGRMPEKKTECVVEEAMLSMLGVALGDTITLTPSDTMDDALAGATFTVVGTVRSPIYVSIERGTSSIGTGTVKGYLYLPRDAFTLDYYTAIYLRVRGAAEMTAFYDDYNDKIDDVIDVLEPLGEQRAALRHDELVDEATEKLDDAQQKLDDAKAEADKKLGDAARELRDARKELTDGWQEYRDSVQALADARAELADALVELQDGEKEYNDGKAEYEDGLRDYQDGLSEYETGKAEYEDGARKLNAALAELESGEAELLSGRKKLEESQTSLTALAETVLGLDTQSPAPALTGETAATLLDKLGANDAAACAATDALLTGARAQMDAGIAQYQSGIEQAEGSIAKIEAALATLQADPVVNAAQIAALTAQKAEADGMLQTLRGEKATLETQRAQLPESITAAYVGAGKRELAAGWQEYYAGRAKLDSGWAEYNSGKADLAAAKKKLADAETELADAKKKLADAETELTDARKELDDGWKEYYDGCDEAENGENELADALIELQDGEKEYRDGYAEYIDAKAEAEEKIADAEKEIADARRKVADIETGEWYILSRSYNPGYTGFGQDAERMGNLASVFPVIFFLVAALVCLTTMTRMVEEQRVQIGCLKALGYSRFAISRKYLGYGLLPSLLGGVLGLVVGYTLFPSMIFTAYQIMYQVPNIELRWYGDISAYSVLAAVACTTVSTLWACLSTLREVPAGLMRPHTPKAGKRVLLEYIKPLWRRMKFTHKVTARNLFRYQKRFWMTVIGIGGCTALIIAGFGLRSSLLYTMSRQYGELFHYTAQVALSDNVLSEERAAIEQYLTTDDRITALTRCDVSSVTAASDSYSITAYVEALDPDELGQFVEVYDYKTGETLRLSDDGVYIDEKLSELLDVGVGDSFLIDGDVRANVTVAGIFEHYTAHFIYMTPAYYETAFGEAAEASAYLLTFENDTPELCDEIFAHLMELNGVAATTRMSDTQDTYLHSMERIDFVVVIVILAAASLAMVVLYNLSNINITERQRELATIKLLGFYDGEVSAYVYRENIVLTIIGVALGILMGHYLHVYLVLSTEIDLMMFGRETDPMSYLYAAVLTAVFSFAVNLMAHFKMKKIDMVESLKSAE